MVWPEPPGGTVSPLGNTCEPMRLPAKSTLGVGVGPGGGVGTAGDGEGDGDTAADGDGDGCGKMPPVLEDVQAPSASVEAMNAAPHVITRNCFSFITHSLT